MVTNQIALLIAFLKHALMLIQVKITQFKAK
jgi:hypothetical protein